MKQTGSHTSCLRTRAIACALAHSKTLVHTNEHMTLYTNIEIKKEEKKRPGVFVLVAFSIGHFCLSGRRAGRRDKPSTIVMSGGYLNCERSRAKHVTPQEKGGVLGYDLTRNVLNVNRDGFSYGI